MLILFLQKYTTSMDFVRKFERQCGSQASVKRLRSHPSYHSFNNKWNLPVYFQIRLVCICSHQFFQKQSCHSKMIQLMVRSPHYVTKFPLSTKLQKSNYENIITEPSHCFMHLPTLQQNHRVHIAGQLAVITLNFSYAAYEQTQVSLKSGFKFCFSSAVSPWS